MTNDAKMPNRYWGAHKPPKSKAEFFNAVTAPRATDGGTVATIRMYGPIDSWGGWWGISTKDVGEVLDALPDSVDQIILRINSPGGEVFEGVSILNMLRAHKAKVVAVVDGLAASAASFIAAGCDETVMSPGTQMMIHSPLVFTYGNSVELRKTAEVLDGIQDSIVEIYQAKAGDADWAALLADETWYTATEAVAQGLADRVAVIPDAGETETVGADDDDLLVIPDGDDVEDRTRLRYAAASRTFPMPPVSSEPGDPNRKEDVMAYDDLQAGLRERLGVTDAGATDEQLLAAVDTLTARAAVGAPPTIPEGVQMIDAAVLASLQEQAAQGAAARAEQTRTRREGILDAAEADGRIAPASRETWAALLEENEERATTVLDGLQKNKIPVSELGHSDTVTSAESALYAKAWGADEKGA